MAASITANPNPVLIPVWTLGFKKTRITWDTDSNALGRVFVSVDGGAEQFFDGTPLGGTPGRRSGSKEQVIELGKTYDFRLKRASAPNVDLVLATVRIKGEERVGTTGGLLTVMKGLIPRAQHISALEIYPGIESVRIRFRTRQAAPVLIEVRNEVTKAVVGVALFDGRLVHDVLIAHGANFTPHPLAHDTNHSFRIVASSLPGSMLPGDKTLTGRFRTGGRTAQFFFDKIVVHDDGDAGFSGAGDFWFYFGAGEVESGERLGNWEHFEDTIPTGGERNVHLVVTIPSAPARMWAQVYALEEDTTLTTILIYGPMMLEYAPPGSTCGVNSQGYGPEATVTEHFDFTGLTDGVEERSMVLKNGPCAFSFTVHGRVRVEAHTGTVLESSFKKSGSAPRSPITRAATLRHAGDEVIVGKEGGIAHTVRLAPGGVALVATSSRTSKEATQRWVPMADEFAGSLTVVATGADGLSLLALDGKGAVRHRRLDAPRKNELECRSLGGAFVGPIAATAGADGRIEIFAMDRDGSVYHRTVRAEGRGEAAGDWQLIGKGAEGDLSTFSSRHGLSVLARGRDGEVLHKLRSDDQWRPAGRKWQLLGAGPAGSLSAELNEDDLVVLAVLAEDETIHLLPWRNYPETPPSDGWQSTGSINSLLDARLSLMPPPPDPVQAGRPS